MIRHRLWCKYSNKEDRKNYPISSITCVFCDKETNHSREGFYPEQRVHESPWPTIEMSAIVSNHVITLCQHMLLHTKLHSDKVYVYMLHGLSIRITIQSNVTRICDHSFS